MHSHDLAGEADNFVGIGLGCKLSKCLARNSEIVGHRKCVTIVSVILHTKYCACTPSVCMCGGYRTLCLGSSLCLMCV